ncbi:MAG: 30S ribosomal protein S5 [Clostridiales bacterium]|jgi:small subunit ribosomal protein S5|nr:30S ribosomal protein S5 [Clostridiales bacterium]
MAIRERGGRPQREAQDDLIKKLVEIRRVAKVVKGGRTMRFSALVVVGNGTGEVGIGIGKSAEVPDAIEKATQEAKKRMVKISVLERTIPHGTVGVFGKGKVILLPGALGSGVIAGGPVRSVLEACGIKDIRTKSIGTNNKINVVRATMNGLMSLRTAEEVAALRGKVPEEL